MSEPVKSCPKCGGPLAECLCCGAPELCRTCKACYGYKPPRRMEPERARESVMRGRELAEVSNA